MRCRQHPNDCADQLQAALWFQDRLSRSSLEFAGLILRPQVLLSAAVLVLVASPLMILSAIAWGALTLLRKSLKPMGYILGMSLVLVIGVAGGYGYSAYQTAIPRADQAAFQGGSMSPGSPLSRPVRRGAPADAAVPSEPSDPFDLLRGQ